ncbi:uncharacterized protein LOC142354714 isoform X2 [Convolutriloba macropyga]|uniref:uncharacterized protein LOC142354714 isoform X2 n=1 Tax=Convolutriloba macropyga TaxID=536237 RepID=UPI003F528137
MFRPTSIVAGWCTGDMAEFVKLEPGLPETYGEEDFASMFGLNEFMGNCDNDTVTCKSHQSGGQNSNRGQSVQVKHEDTLTRQNFSPSKAPFSDQGPRFPVKMNKVSNLNQKATKLKQQALVRSNLSSPSIKSSPDSRDPDILIQYSYLCPYCSFISAHKSSTHRHISTAHAAVEGVNSKNIGEKMLFLCRYCNFNSNHKTSAKRHIKTIHKEKSTGDDQNHYSEQPRPLEMTSSFQPPSEFSNLPTPVNHVYSCTPGVTQDIRLNGTYHQNKQEQYPMSSIVINPIGHPKYQI